MNNQRDMDRRDFMKTAAVAGGAVLAGTAGSRMAGAADDGLDHRNERLDVMTYRKLGKTNFMCSRLVFGCGAALAGGKAVRLLERAYESGINHYDVGYDDYYRGSEAHLAPFINKYRDNVWVTSKAPARLGPGAELTVERAKNAADYWVAEMEKSLQRLERDYIDAYYLMGVNSPDLVKSEEIGNAFLAQKKAGKVGHFGISTHENAQACLLTAAESEWYSLAMIAITPAGWYDYRANKLTESGTLKELAPVLEKARAAGIGIVGMKAARFIATEPYGGKYGKVNDDSVMIAFDQYYGDKLMNAGLSPFQRSYAYVLEHGVDVMNSDMQNFEHFEENLVAAQSSHTYFA